MNAYFPDGKDFIAFNSYKKDFTLSIGDTISFLFENGVVLSFLLSANSNKNSHPYIQGLYENRALILEEELSAFATSNLIKWKNVLKKRDREITGGDIGYLDYCDKDRLVEVIKKSIF